MGRIGPVEEFEIGRTRYSSVKTQRSTVLMVEQREDPVDDGAKEDRPRLGPGWISTLGLLTTLAVLPWK